MRALALSNIALLLVVAAVAAASQGQWETEGPYGGMIKKVGFDGVEPELCYATGRNGFFRSSDGGRTWQRSVPDAAVYYVSDYSKFCASKAQSGLVFAQLGEPGLLYRSQDGGLSWSLLDVPWVGETIMAIACDPGNSGHVCVATTPGAWWASEFPGKVFRSLDKGATWETIYEGLGVVSVCIDPSDSETIWIGCPMVGPKRTTDGGKSWETLADGITTVQYVKDIYVSPALPHDVFVCSNGLYRWVPSERRWELCNPYLEQIAFCWSKPSRMYGISYFWLWVSDDAGASWEMRTCEDMPEYVAASPADKSQILVAGRTLVWRSSDGGKRLVQSSNGITAQRCESLMICPDGEETLICAGYRLLARRRESVGGWEIEKPFWRCWDLLIAQDPTDLDVLYTTNLWEHSLLVSRDAGWSWFYVSELPSCLSFNSLAVDPNNSERLYLLGWPERVFRSEDGGRSWSELAGSSSIGAKPVCIAVDPRASRRFFLGTSGGVYVTNDDGETFKRVAGAGAFPTFIRFDPSNPSCVYVGLSDYLYRPPRALSRSKDGGETWERIETPIKFVYGMAINPDDGADFYIAGEGGVYRTRDGGKSWTALPQEGLQGSLLSSILVKFGDGGNRIYAAGTAVFSYFEQGWPFVSLSLPSSFYRAGETLRIGCRINNTGETVLADFVVAVMLPDERIVYLPSMGPEYQAFFSGEFPAGLDVEDYPLFEASVLPTWESGRYDVFAALVEPGTTRFISNLATANFVVQAASR